LTTVNFRPDCVMVVAIETLAAKAPRRRARPRIRGDDCLQEFRARAAASVLATGESAMTKRAAIPCAAQ